MKSGLRNILAVVGIGFFALCGSAHALTFTISDINFTGLVGNAENFRWSLSPVADFTFDLDVGNSQTFKYGSFYTDDFSINPPAGGDNDDQFTASFKVAPPVPAQPSSEVGVPDATYVRSESGSATVDFDNTLLDRYFGVGGYYTVMFKDVPSFSFDGNYDLEATIKLINIPGGGDDQDVNPVPEPSTVVLLGSGLLGLFYVGRRRSRK